MKKYSVALVVLMLVVVPAAAFGAGLVQIVPEECNQDGGCPSVCNIGQLAQNLLNNGIFIAVFLSAFLFAWAGLKLLTNMSNPEQISSAKAIFQNVAIGLVIIVGAWLVIDTVMKTLTGGKIGPWNKMCVLWEERIAAPFA